MSGPEIDPNKAYTDAEVDALTEAIDHPDIPFELSSSSARGPDGERLTGPNGERLWKLELLPWTPPRASDKPKSKQKAALGQKGGTAAAQYRSAPPAPAPAPPPPPPPYRAPQRQWKPGEVDAILAKARLEREGVPVLRAPEGTDLKVFPEQVPAGTAPVYRGEANGVPLIDYVPLAAYRV